MKNLKPAWKLFFTMFKQNRLVWMPVLFTALGVGVMILVSIEGDAIGNEEHLLSASFIGTGYYLIFCGLLFVLISFLNNRFFLSCPESKAVITRVLPILSGVINITMTAISLVSAISGGHTPQMLSDVIIFNTFSAVLAQLGMASITVQNGFIIFYICMLPNLMLTFTKENPPTEFLGKLYLNGFGVPVEISALIYVLAVAVVFAVSFKLADLSYGKRNVRLINAAAQNPMMAK